jgi:hypothetical protein
MSLSQDHGVVTIKLHPVYPQRLIRLDRGVESSKTRGICLESITQLLQHQDDGRAVGTEPNPLHPSIGTQGSARHFDFSILFDSMVRSSVVAVDVCMVVGHGEGAGWSMTRAIYLTTQASPGCAPHNAISSHTKWHLSASECIPRSSAVAHAAGRLLDWGPRPLSTMPSPTCFN